MLNHNEALEEYINAHIDAEPADLKALYRHTYLHCLYPRMCSGHYQGRLLKMLTAMINPSKVLELGTFTGYSTLSIAEGLSDGAVIDTVEIDIEKEDELRERFASSPFADKIRLHIGDALEVIEKLEGSYQMVFMDANKRQYQDYLEAILRILPVGGFVLADNTLWDMKVIMDQAGADCKTDAIARFNDSLAADSRFEKVILPVRDGLTLIRRVG